MYTIESKNQLARLMATENLVIEHQKISTAKFDPINRILYLPIWQNMTGFIYDLLTGHEVGHALYTPPQGWHDAVLDKSKPKSYKHFLNVVEDARIEKRIQRKYPGLRLSFKQAYEELFKRNFFGIENRDVNKLAFIDRLNIYSKSQYTKDIKFKDEEITFINEVKNAESWEDVIAITDKIFAYSKDEQFEMQQNDFQYDFSDSDQNQDDQSMGDPDEYDYDGEESTEESEQETESKEKTESKESKTDDESGDESEEETSDTNTKKDNEADFDDEIEDESESNQLNRDKESIESEKDEFVPTCETDEKYRENENSLLDATCKPYIYLSFPKPDLTKIITPWKRVHEQMNTHWKTYPTIFTQERIIELTNKFKSKNEKYVSLLVKEFEMRKAAKNFAKNKVSITGDLNINKLANYRIDDNIFRKIMAVPNGKKHGLILLLDYSGSMSDKMNGSIEQILILAMFCRKVNIPYRVYAFGDSQNVRCFDHNISRDTLVKCFSRDENEVFFSNVQLREYLNNEMTNAEFTNAFRNMILLKEIHDSDNFHSPLYGYRPRTEELTNTPLTQAIVAITDVMAQFKRNNNLDITNLIVVHDGDADQNIRYCKIGRTPQFNTLTENIIISDKKSKFQYQLGSIKTKSDDTLIAALNYFRYITKSNIVGFFVAESSKFRLRNSLYRRYVSKESDGIIDTSLLIKKLRTDKYLESYNPVYDAFYIVASDDIVIDDEEFDIEEGASQRKVVTAFMKFNKKRQINRVLVNKFIQRIAA